MKKISLFAICLFLFPANHLLQAQSDGKEIFESTCTACHTIGSGRLVGPDLSGIYQIRTNEWLISFIRSSQQFIKSGDSLAVAIFEEYNRVQMPDNRLSDAQILSIIDFIRESDQDLQAVGGAAAISEDSLAIIYSIEHMPAGRALFYGHTRFANNAPPCISCHNINDQSVLGGGKMALDLTGSYAKLGAPGIAAIIKNPPFPVMKRAMLNHEINEDESQALISLFKADGEQPYPAGKRGLIFFGLGLVCALILLGHIYILYDRRRIP